MGYGEELELGGMATFNMQHGFVEALVRGYRSGFLKDSDYHHLSQCETLEVKHMHNLEPFLYNIAGCQAQFTGD